MAVLGWVFVSLIVGVVAYRFVVGKWPIKFDL